MLKGGYQIIDFNGIEFRRETPMQLSNIYDKIEGTNKAILLSGLNVNGIDYRDVLCMPIVIGNSYVIKVFNFRIYISDDDIVRVEDEILSLYNIEEMYDGEIPVSPYTYNRLEECLYGNFSTFKAERSNGYDYLTIIGTNLITNTLYSVHFGEVTNINLLGQNKISIS